MQVDVEDGWTVRRSLDDMFVPNLLKHGPRGGGLGVGHTERRYLGRELPATRRQIKASTVNCEAKNVNGLSIRPPPASEVHRSLACLFRSRQKQRSLEFPALVLSWSTNFQALPTEQRWLWHHLSHSDEPRFNVFNFLAKQDLRDAKTAEFRVIES
jgi:hypothetical protein